MALFPLQVQLILQRKCMGAPLHVAKFFSFYALGATWSRMDEKTQCAIPPPPRLFRRKIEKDILVVSRVAVDTRMRE